MLKERFYIKLVNGEVQPHECPQMPTPIRNFLLSNGHSRAKFFLARAAAARRAKLQEPQK